MTSEHLRILLENVRDGHLFFLMGQQLAQVAPEAATQAMRLGRLTALRKAERKRRRSTVGVQDDHSTAQRYSGCSHIAVPIRPLHQGPM